MKAHLTEMDKFLLIRPIFGDYQLNEFGMPILKRVPIDNIDFNSVIAQHYKNLSPRKDNSSTLALMFQLDPVIDVLWRQPLRWIALFQTCIAIASPDYSLSPAMNINDIRHNIYRARWLACLWQYYGCIVWPTIGWVGPDTYDICLGAVEPGSPVVISTLGCQETKDVFLEGFNEMKRRINPPIIVVYGDMIEGMTGTFVNFKYRDVLVKKSIQMRMDEVPVVFTVKEAN